VKTRTLAFVVAILTGGALCLSGFSARASSEPSEAVNAAWGRSANGLRCSISLSETKLRVGDPLVVTARLQNVSDKPVTIIYHMPSCYEGERLAIEAASGEQIKGYQSGIADWLSAKPPLELIGPGATFTATIRGRICRKFVRASYLSPQNADRPIILDSGLVTHELISPGEFRMSFRFTCDDKTAALGAPYGVGSVWTGSVVSNVVPFSVRTMRRDELDQTIEKLRTGTEEEKTEAAQVIGANADRQAVPALMEVLASGGYYSTDRAAGALCSIGDWSIVPQLMQLYRSAESDDRRAVVIEVMRSVIPDVGDIAAELVKSDASPTARRSAAYLVAGAASRLKVKAVHVLLEAAKAPDPQVQRAAIDGLASLEDDGLKLMIVVDLLGVMKSDPDATVRSRAAQAFGRIGDTSVVPALIRALKDPDPWVGSYAAHSLGRLAGPEAIGALEDYAKVAPRESQVNAARAAIAEIQRRAGRR